MEYYIDKHLYVKGFFNSPGYNLKVLEIGGGSMKNLDTFGKGARRSSYDPGGIQR